MKSTLSIIGLNTIFASLILTGIAPTWVALLWIILLSVSGLYTLFHLKRNNQSI